MVRNPHKSTTSNIRSTVTTAASPLLSQGSQGQQIMAKFGAIPNTQNAALVMLLSRSTWAQDPHHYEDVFDTDHPGERPNDARVNANYVLCLPQKSLVIMLKARRRLRWSNS